MVWSRLANKYHREKIVVFSDRYGCVFGASASLKRKKRAMNDFGSKSGAPASVNDERPTGNARKTRAMSLASRLLSIKPLSIACSI